MAFHGRKQKTRKGKCLDCDKAVGWERRHGVFHLVEKDGGALHIPCAKCGVSSVDCKGFHPDMPKVEMPEPIPEPDEVDVETPDEADLWSAVNAITRAVTGMGTRVGELESRPIPEPKAQTIEIRGLPVPPETPEDASDLAHEGMPELLQCLTRDLPVFVHGEAGTGKSHAGRAAAKAMGLEYRECIMGPSDPASKLLGLRMIDGTIVKTQVREAWEHGGVLLFDEVCASNPSVLTVLNNAIESGRLDFPDGPIMRHKDCRMMLADNTDGERVSAHYPTRRVLDPAFLSRFYRFEWVRDEALETAVATSRAAGDDEALATCLEFYRRVRAREWPVPVSVRSLYKSCVMLAHSDFSFEKVRRACYPSRIIEGMAS